VTYSAKEESSFITAGIRFYCMVPKREGLLMVCNKPKLVLGLCMVLCMTLLGNIYRVIQNDCRGFNNLSYTIHLR